MDYFSSTAASIIIPLLVIIFIILLAGGFGALKRIFGKGTQIAKKTATTTFAKLNQERDRVLQGEQSQAVFQRRQLALLSQINDNLEKIAKGTSDKPRWIV